MADIPKSVAKHYFASGFLTAKEGLADTVESDRFDDEFEKIWESLEDQPEEMGE